MVRLFHRESECYISAEGSFALRNGHIEDGSFSCRYLSHNY